MEPHYKTENYSNLLGINTKISKYIQGPEQFLNLSNFDFTTPGSLTKRYGSTLFSSSVVSGRVTGLYEYEKLSGFSQIIMTANTNVYRVPQGGAPVTLDTGYLNNAIFDFTTFVDHLFLCNGDSFKVWNGTTMKNFSVPEGNTLAAGTTGTGSLNGTFRYTYAFVDSLGHIGPVSPTYISISPTNVFAANIQGWSTPSGYGITSVAIYRTSNGGTDFFRIGSIAPPSATFIDTNLSLTAEVPSDTIWFTMMPRYLELFNNQLFMAGFSSQLSTFWFSEIGEPQNVNLINNIEVRTNDGDRITGMKPFNGDLVIFKERSMHRLSGDNPDNFLLREISTEYGCLSNRAIVNWEDYCWFLDKKGIAEFNGANVKVISEPIQPIFDAMNLSAAKDNAVAIHNRQRNEIWFGIPCNGSTLNNCTVVYDYIAHGWTKFEGFQPSSLNTIQAGFTAPIAAYGSYSGAIANFSYDQNGDLGQAITAMIQTRFISGSDGHSAETFFRRLWMNCDSVLGITAPIEINFRQDYGSSIVLNRTMYLNPFQSRIDFGIPAKALSIEFASVSASLPIRIHGYSVEMRKQRDV